MSEIMALRAQIMDNMEMLNYPDLQLCRFVLTVDHELHDGDPFWHVFLDKPTHHPFNPDQPSMTKGYGDIKFQGEGDTPEDAYKDLLKWTAEMLHNGYVNSKKM
ncbi:hypothetical protein KCU95_g945, partial [Aureobasidium melanogenum]